MLCYCAICLQCCSGLPRFLSQPSLHGANMPRHPCAHAASSFQQPPSHTQLCPSHWLNAVRIVQVNVLDGAGVSPNEVFKGQWTYAKLSAAIQKAFAQNKIFQNAHDGASPMTGG
jgi:hypothetical protein